MFIGGVGNRKKTLLYQQTFQVINKIADFPHFTCVTGKSV